MHILSTIFRAVGGIKMKGGGRANSIQKATSYREFRKHLNELFSSAHESQPMNCVFALTRVDYVAYGHFDPTVEVIDAVSSFSKLRNDASSEDPNTQLRLDLLIYCHLTELSMPYDVIMNLLRCCKKEPNMISPFGEQKYPINKIQMIKKYAQEIRKDQVVDDIEKFFDNNVRNAFSHSKYCITEDDFRIIDEKIYIKLDDLRTKLNDCFAFYQAFFDVFNGFKMGYRTFYKYHPQENDERAIFELLTNEELGLFGFCWHHSDGTVSMFYRLPKEVSGQNMRFNRNGGVTFVWGEKNALKRKYMLNGQLVEDIEKLKQTRCHEYNDFVSMNKHKRIAKNQK